MKRIHKIVVPTDFSDLSLTALQYVLSLGEMFDSRIFVVNVIDGTPVYTFPQVDQHSETLLRDMELKAKETLQRLLSQSVPPGRMVIPVVRRGDAARSIVEYAAEEGIDLIVMATHGRTGLVHMLIGSVAEKVVRYSPVPVITVKPSQFSGGAMDELDIEEQLHL